MFILDLFLLVILGGGLTILELTLIEFDRYGWSAIALVVSLGASYYLINGVSEFVNAVGWSQIAIYAAEFLGIGVGVAFLKWLQLVGQFSGRLADYKSTFTVSQFKTDEGGNLLYDTRQDGGRGSAQKQTVPLDTDNAEHTQAFFDKVTGSITREDRKLARGINCIVSKGASPKTKDELIHALVPKALKAADRITSWIFTWPFVVVHTVFADVLIKLGRHAARVFDWAFGRVSRLIVANGLK